jgi:hypothetical protein
MNFTNFKNYIKEGSNKFKEKVKTIADKINVQRNNKDEDKLKSDNTPKEENDTNPEIFTYDDGQTHDVNIYYPGENEDDDYIDDTHESEERSENLTSEQKEEKRKSIEHKKIKTPDIKVKEGDLNLEENSSDDDYNFCHIYYHRESYMDLHNLFHVKCLKSTKKNKLFSYIGVSL